MELWYGTLDVKGLEHLPSVEDKRHKTTVTADVLAVTSKCFRMMPLRVHHNKPSSKIYVV
eukprot:scaffold294_cov221-Amphora_coffeaeformis.AAC.35